MFKLNLFIDLICQLNNELFESAKYFEFYVINFFESNMITYLNFHFHLRRVAHFFFSLPHSYQIIKALQTHTFIYRICHAPLAMPKLRFLGELKKI